MVDYTNKRPGVTRISKKSAILVTPGLRRFALTRRGQGRRFRFGDHAWGVQFHPEVTRDVIEGWLGVAGDTAARWGKTPDQIRAEGRLYLEDEEKRAREMIRRFAAVVRDRADA